VQVKKNRLAVQLKTAGTLTSDGDVLHLEFEADVAQTASDGKACQIRIPLGKKDFW
jgi:hypothetical protein